MREVPCDDAVQETAPDVTYVEAAAKHLPRLDFLCRTSRRFDRKALGPSARLSRGSDEADQSPVPRNTTSGVITRIHISVEKDMAPAYRASYIARSANEHALRSLICHSPVMPGRIWK